MYLQTPLVLQELREGLGLDTTQDPVDYCFTSDDVTSPGQWWQQRMILQGHDPAMTSESYLDIFPHSHQVE